MSKRFTITEKWEDGWFWQLPPHQKLLWNYLCDKCDLAGFWEINLELAAVQTKIPKTAISGAVQGLNRGYYTNGKYLWLRNFIHHQSNYPLNPKNNAHRHIIAILERHTDFDIDFFEILETTILAPKEELISSPSKGSGKGKGNSKGKYTEDFETFWKKYPTRWIPESDKHVKVGKHLAWEQWEKISEETHRHILGIISQMKAGRAVPDPWRWLRDKKFLDFVTEQPRPDKKAIAEQEERRKQKIRDGYGKYYREIDTEELKVCLKSYGCTLERFLIKEILTERAKK